MVAGYYFDLKPKHTHFMFIINFVQKVCVKLLNNSFLNRLETCQKYTS